VTALTTPVLWHFNPDEVLQRFSNSNSNINSNCVRTVELDNLSSPRSSSVESSVLSSSAMSKAVSPGSALDASVTASQEVEGVEMTVKEAERMLSRVLKKNVREVIFMSNMWYHFYFSPNTCSEGNIRIFLISLTSSLLLFFLPRTSPRCVLSDSSTWGLSLLS
jgi:hypothetical protein